MHTLWSLLALPRPSELGATYRAAVKHLRSCCLRVEELLLAKQIGVRDCELIYESAFLNAIARFEGLLNGLLEEFVCGPRSTLKGKYPLIATRSRGAYRKVLTRGRAYVELMPYDRCTEIAKYYLNSGRPFTDIDAADVTILKQAVLVRNAIAHRSDAAMMRFRTDVSGVEVLPVQRRFPGVLLRRPYRAAPAATWNELYFDTLEKVAGQLATSW
jgi:hypothetical protein